MNFPYKGKRGAATLWFVFLPAIYLAMVLFILLQEFPELRAYLFGDETITTSMRAGASIASLIVGIAVILGWALRFWLVLASVMLVFFAVFFAGG
jgi:hypothetical protein